MAGLFAFFAASPAQAIDPLKIFKSNENPLTIMKLGYQAYKDGRKDEAAGAFRFAAEKNQLAAKWKLGRMYAIGDGVHQDEGLAFKLYREIADEYSEIRPKFQDRIFVSNAVASVADYYRTGIKSARLKPNIRLAVDFYYRAAALYGNRHAQYQLGRIYLDGKLGKSQPIQAARWLRAAAKKSHPAAQAVLGKMLFEGNGIRRRRVQGLMLMTMAVGSNARGKVAGKFRWIKEWREKAFKAASQEERVEAVKLADRKFASTVGTTKVKKAGKKLATAPVARLPEK